MFEGQPSPQSAADSSSNPSSNADWLLRNYEMRMVAAEANKDTHCQWTYFKAVLNRLINRMDSESKRTMLAELATLHQYEMEIETKIENKTNQEAALHELYQAFMGSHLAYLYLTMVRSGETPINEMAQLDFTKQDYETIKTMVHFSHDGLTTGNKRIKEPSPVKDFADSQLAGSSNSPERY